MTECKCVSIDSEDQDGGNGGQPSLQDILNQNSGGINNGNTGQPSLVDILNQNGGTNGNAGKSNFE